MLCCTLGVSAKLKLPGDVVGSQVAIEQLC